MTWRWQHTRRQSSTSVESQCSTCLCTARECHSCSQDQLRISRPAISLTRLVTGSSSNPLHSRHLPVSLTIDSTDCRILLHVQTLLQNSRSYYSCWLYHLEQSQIKYAKFCGSKKDIVTCCKDSIADYVSRECGLNIFPLIPFLFSEHLHHSLILPLTDIQE